MAEGGRDTPPCAPYSNRPARSVQIVHLTFCYKDGEQLKNNIHTACHGYTKDELSWELLESAHAGDKPDAVKRRYSKSTSIWPGAEELDEAPEIGYGHFL